MRCLVTVIILAAAQQAWAQGPASCRASLAPQELRQGSLAELAGDLTVECTGGASGPMDLLVLSDAAFGNRDLSPEIDPGWGLTDALLLIGDPAPPSQIACVPASSNAACAANGGFNVFQGRRLQDNLIAFQSIPYDAAAPRRFRIVNLRVAALGTAPVLQILAYAGGKGTSIENASLPLPAIHPAPAAVVQLASGTPAGDKGFTLPRGQLPLGDPTAASTFRIQLTESSPNGFRRRNVGSNAADPTFVASQANPGAVYGTETGFYNAALPAQHGLNDTGLADSGTRIRIHFEGIPRGILLWAPVRDASGRALLTYAKPDGSGSFSPVSPEVGSYSSLFVENGQATATFEVISADTARIETLVLQFAVSALDGSPGLGAVTAVISLGPSGPAGAYPVFQSEPAPVTAFRIVNAIEAPPLAIVSAATLTGASISPDSVATILGANLAADPMAATGGLKPSIGDTAVKIVDATGAESAALLYYVSPTQINFVAQGTLAPGPALVRVLRNEVVVGAGTVNVEHVAPGLFTADGNPAGIASGLALRIASAVIPAAPLARQAENQLSAASVSFGDEGDLVYLSLYATGLRHRTGIENIAATIGGIPVPVLYAGASPAGPGVDQINLGPLSPGVFRGVGERTIQITVDGKPTNAVIAHFGQ